MGDYEVTPETWRRAAGVYRQVAEALSAQGVMDGFDAGRLCPGGPQTVADMAISVVFPFGAQFVAERCGDVVEVLGESAAAMEETAVAWEQVEADNVGVVEAMG